MTPAERIDALAPVATALLPASATPFERAMLATDLAALAEIDPAVIATIWDPWTCPVPLLPWLAYAVSVDVWDAKWSTDVKRSAIAASPLVHRLKGTRGAVARVLAALRLSASITEWWEQSPPARHGTFDVTVFANARLYDDQLSILDARVQEAAIASVRAAKPKSRTFTFKLGAGFADRVGLADGMAAMDVTNRQVIARPDLTRRSVIGVANRSVSMAISHRQANARPPLDQRSIIGAASRFAAMETMTRSFAA